MHGRDCIFANSASDMLDRAVRACDLLGLPQSGPILVACSGGSDSAAALMLTRSARPHAELVACYVDHGLRPAASIEKDIDAVRSHAQSASARLVVAKIEPPRRGESREAGARDRRYAALADAARRIGAPVVVVGHHADDVAETMLLALLRGSGIDGAASMKSRRRIAPGVTLVRPFLWASKDELARFARAHDLRIASDESNADLAIRRNAVRRLLDGLEAVAPHSRGALVRSANLFAADKSLLDGLTKTAWEGCRDRTDARALRQQALRSLPRALLQRVIRYAVKKACVPRDFHLEHCHGVASAIYDRRGGRYHAGKNAHIVLTAGKFFVEVELARPVDQGRPPQPVSIRVPSVGKVTRARTPLGDLKISWNSATRARSSMNFSGLSPGRELTVRQPMTGDRCVPSGRTKSMSLTRFLAKAGVPKDERPAVALLCVGASVAAVLGIRVMEPYAAKTGMILAARWRPRQIQADSSG